MKDRERNNYEQRIAELQYEIEQQRIHSRNVTPEKVEGSELKKLEKSNDSLRMENEALIRVLSKMSRQQSTPTWPRYGA
ncbi:unnamed protein product [Onchocerca flexuosa]|uniref:PRKG1_interact domain-containing protein n=1 Tax=Onchocerca flexuosa TaxID=387005 RepID=A0A183HPL3_9BILA|nr:unnamed protein product [Onchocerca flexuosa]